MLSYCVVFGVHHLIRPPSRQVEFEYICRSNSFSCFIIFSKLSNLMFLSLFYLVLYVVIGFPSSEYLSESLIMMKEDTAFECVFSVSKFCIVYSSVFSVYFLFLRYLMLKHCGFLFLLLPSWYQLSTEI